MADSLDTTNPSRRTVISSGIAAAGAFVALTVAMPAAAKAKFDAQAFVTEMEAFGDTFHIVPSGGFAQSFDPNDSRLRSDAGGDLYRDRHLHWMRLYRDDEARSRAAVIAYLRAREA